MVTKLPFNGQRLKAARTYSEVTIKDLAEAVNVSKQSISLYENGQNSPTYEKLIQISAYLNFPMGYFIEEDEPEIPSGTTYFRSLTSTTKAHRSAQHERMKILSKILDIMMQYVDFPQLNFIQDDKLMPDQAAKKIRELWNLGNQPIDNLIRVAERNGVVITSLSTDKNKIDAYSKWIYFKNSNRPVVILTEDKRSAVRRQFDLAHELGHLVMHAGIDVESLKPSELRPYEAEANEFAGYLLLPEDGFFSEQLFPTELSDYERLKSRWKTSIMAMIIRTYKQGIITFGEYDYLVRTASKQGFRTKEPLDDVIPIQKPILLKQAVELLMTENIIPNNNFETLLISNKLSLGKRRIEYLLGLEEGTLDIPVKDDAIVNLKTISQFV